MLFKQVSEVQASLVWCFEVGMRSAAVGSLLRQLRYPPQCVPAGFQGAPPPFSRLELTPTGQFVISSMESNVSATH